MSSTYNITPTDFKARMQSIACCLASKGYDIANKLKVGNYCTDGIKRFQVATAMMDLMECYDSTRTDTLPFITSINSTLAGKLSQTPVLYTQLLITSPNITYTVPLSSNTLAEIITKTIDIIDDVEEVFNIVVGRDDDITITTPCYWGEQEVTFTFSGSGTQSITGTLPECTQVYTDNCTTTDQINQRFEWFQEYCDVCFNADYGAYEQAKNTD